MRSKWMVVTVLLLSSCATLLKNDLQSVSFDSNVDAVSVYLDGRYLGETPLETALHSSSSYNVTFRKQGYGDKSVVLANAVELSWLIIDLPLIIPALIDAATGKWLTFTSTYVYARMEAEPDASTADEPVAVEPPVTARWL